MINYNKLAYQLKRKIKVFSDKISKGLTKPKTKLVFHMLYGLLEAQSVHLSNISRALKEDITLKKTIERLSRNLNCFTENETVFNNYINEVSKHFKEKPILIVDHSDISKPKSEMLECLGRVRDGSTGKYTNGYHLLEIAALTEKHKMPTPVYSRIYSSREVDFISEDEEVLNGLKFLSRQFGKAGIRTLDRGYDTNVYYDYFIRSKENFIVRAKSNRNVIYKNKVINILDLAHKFKGKYAMVFNGKKGEKINCKMSSIPIKLPLASNKELNLVVIYGFGKKPMMLITNMTANNACLPKVITKVYLMRWRIEEYYKFKKQQFGFEDFRVQSLNSIRALNLILTVLIGLLSIFSEKQNESLLIY